MHKIRLITLFAIIFATALAPAAQKGTKSAGTPPVTPQASTPPSTESTSASGTGRREPCWKVAGIAPSALQQRRGIEQNAKSQIAAVCSDRTLSAQQRREKIREIHQQTQQQLQGMITPQQQEALKACRASRGEGAETPHPSGGGGAGPCAGAAEQTATPAGSNWKSK